MVKSDSTSCGMFSYYGPVMSKCQKDFMSLTCTRWQKPCWKWLVGVLFSKR